MKRNYIFHNFTDKDFTGFWNGKPYTFKPGAKKQYPKGIAEHFAKHLANQVLTESGKETYTSPKKPLEVPAFMDIFNKARLYEEVPDEDNLDIPIEGEVIEPSMNVKVEKREPTDPYNANAQENKGPGQAPQVVEVPDETEEYESSPVETSGTQEPAETPAQPVVPVVDDKK